MDWRSQFELFMPHGMCLLWRPELMTLHIVSDVLIALAYFTIPFGIAQFVRGRDDLLSRHRALAVLFAGFIFFCGLTHLVSIVVLWIPIYIIEGWLKAATALVSVATAGLLFTLVPRLVRLPSIQTLQREIEARRLTLAELTAARAALALKVERTEGELRNSEFLQQQSATLLATVIEAVPGLIYAKDRMGRMLMANKATLGLIGRAWPDVAGRQDREVLPDRRQAELVMANDRRVMEAGTVQELEELVDYPGKGARVWLSTKVPFGNQDGVSGLVGISIDITDRKRLEKELIHISRRSAMSELGVAIAHEVNQPLTAIAQYISGCIILLGREKANGVIASTLQLANEQCTRAGDIIQRLRSFVSGEEIEKSPTELRPIIDAACNLVLLGVRERDSIIVVRETVQDMLVCADQIQIEQVVLILVRNAFDALGNTVNGRVTIDIDADADNMAVVTVSDNGPGIRVDVIERLFQPFVSTKGIKGMGIGLSICRTIIESHGGRIIAESSEGAGATFRFTLPLAYRAETGSLEQS